MRFNPSAAGRQSWNNTSWNFSFGKPQLPKLLVNHARKGGGGARRTIESRAGRAIEGGVRTVPNGSGGTSTFREFSKRRNERQLSPSVSGGLFFHQKSNFSLLRLRRRHELADGVKHNLELSVVFFLQVSQLSGELGIRRQHLPAERRYA